MSKLPPSASPQSEKPWNSCDLMHKIIELADDAIIVADQDQRITLFNQGAQKIFGYSSKEVLGQPLDILLPSRLVRIHREHMDAFASSATSSRGMSEREQILGRRKNGNEFPAEASISKIVVSGALTFTVILRDITDRIHAEEEIRSSLREKEALLQEIHHRVKNNLQVVASLLALQARSVSDDRTRQMFEESHNRIHSLALLHESLYRSSDLSRIPFAGYIQTLINHLFRYYEVGKRITLETHLEDLYLSLDTAIPCGLILNELASNALKHAFPDQRRGKIHITLRKSATDRAELAVRDDGQGMTKSLANAETLGLRLVRTLADQLSASILVTGAPGTTVRLEFPLPA